MMDRAVGNVPPAIEQRPVHAQNAYFVVVIVVTRLAHDLLCTPAVAGRERLIQLAENK